MHLAGPGPKSEKAVEVDKTEDISDEEEDQHTPTEIDETQDEDKMEHGEEKEGMKSEDEQMGEQEDLPESGCEDEKTEEKKNGEQEESEQEEGQDGNNVQEGATEVKQSKETNAGKEEDPCYPKRVTMNPDEAETMSLEPFDPQLWRLDSKEDSQLLIRVDEKEDVSERNEEKGMPYVEDLVSDEDKEDTRGTFKDLGTKGHMQDTNTHKHRHAISTFML